MKAVQKSFHFSGKEKAMTPRKSMEGIAVCMIPSFLLPQTSSRHCIFLLLMVQLTHAEIAVLFQVLQSFTVNAPFL